MTENAKTPVVGYVRCSTDKQGYSILDQKKAITEFANRLGYEITEWFADEGKSGVGMEHRRALVRMLELVERERADFKYILVYDVSRWGRYGDPDEAAYWEYHCKRCGVEVLYITENFPEDNQMATAMLKMMKRVEAGEYSRKLSHLATRGSRTAAEHGFWNGATAPYGYKRLLVDDKGNPVKVLEKGERKYQKNWKVKLTPGDRRKINIVRKIFDLYVNKDIGLKAICSTLNREGIPSPKGGKWGITIIHRILSNEVYTGTLIWGKTKKGKFAMAENTWGDSNPTKTFHDKDFWVVCVNAHEAIIDRDFFEKARILANARNRFGTNSIVGRRILHISSRV